MTKLPGVYKAFLRDDPQNDQILVGYMEKDQSGPWPYNGPTARISFDENWLNICTDDYEGNAAINIEALPQLQKALRMVAKRLKAKTP